MRPQKKTYYISVGPGQIMTTPNDSPWEFKIEATDDDIIKLRQIFDSNYDNSIIDFWRTHVPLLEYHHDSTNDQNDENLIRVYQMIYELGDEQAKQHIDSIGILQDFTSK
ncbi:MAG TPA: hydrolase [Bacillaceae bacterium]